MCRKEHPKTPQKVRLCKFVPHFQNKIKILCDFYFFASEKHFFMLFLRFFVDYLFSLISFRYSLGVFPVHFFKIGFKVLFDLKPAS